MAQGEVSQLMPAPSTVVFDVLHNYRRRLEWDTLLQAAYLEGDHMVADKGVTSVCIGRRSLGGIALRTIYVTFERPTLAAVKMVNAPAFFGTWAASIHHEDRSACESLLTYRFHFRARPRLLRFILEPIMKAIFVWETRKRLRALRSYLRRIHQA